MRRFAIPTLLVLLLGAAAFGIAERTGFLNLQASLASAEIARSALEKRNRELEKLNSDLSARLNRGPVPVSRGPGGGPGGEDGPPGPGGPQFRGRGGPDGARFASLMNNPEIQKLMSLQQKAALDSRFAALFKQLHLNPEDLDKFKNLLVEKQSAMAEVMSAARNQGLDPRTNRDQIKQLVQNTQTEVDANIRSTLGDAAFDEYKNFETTQPQRNTVTQLEQRLSYSPAPLTDTQSEQLVSILATTADAGSESGGGNRGGPGGMFGGGGGGAKITDAAISQAQGVLTAPQVAALQSLQQEQQTAAALQQQMRASFQNRQNAGPTPGATPAPAPVPAGPAGPGPG